MIYSMKRLYGHQRGDFLPDTLIKIPIWEREWSKGQNNRAAITIWCAWEMGTLYVDLIIFLNFRKII